ncbi:PKD domain-containing protein [Halostella litorea]|uniref:PKD domain-containing protein n=1 Tax=Halostella litorea TaxID=2528831 RepID=UPI0013875A67|nr:PKD domain-containing protein [Halostella litorea]
MTLEWECTVCDAATAPVVANGTVYAGGNNGGNVTAVNATDGTLRWQTSFPGDPRDVAVVDGTGYVINDTSVMAFDPDTGTIDWHHTSAGSDGRYVSDMTVANGTVFYGVKFQGSTSEHLYAVDADTGSQRWTFAAENRTHGIAVADGTVFVSGANATGDDWQPWLYALDADTGKHQWSYDWVESDSSVDYFAREPPAVANGTVYLPVERRVKDGLSIDSYGYVYAFDAASGANSWTTNFTDQKPTGTPKISVANGTVYANSKDYRVEALDASTGTERWQTKLFVEGTSGTDRSYPAVADGMIYVTDANGFIRGFDASDGSEVWSDYSGGIGNYPPAVANGNVYVVDRQGYVQAWGGESTSNQAPAATFTYSPSSPTVGGDVTFDASNSTDSDGSVVSYEWDFDGDGNYEKTGESVTHSFTTNGTTTVSLRVTDDGGTTNTTQQTVEVTSTSKSPTATFTAAPRPGYAGEFITFNASNSTDPDGNIVEYEWDFVGDNSFDSNSSDPDFRFQYDSARQENVTLRVTDESGNTDTYTQTITVEQGAPNATFTTSPQPGYAGEFITFNASNSTDPNDKIVEYEWDFVGDSSFDSNSSESDFRFKYDSARQENITLRVTDADGNTDTFTRTITVKREAPNATFTASPRPAYAGEFITFNASNSTDPNDNIVKYEWDFVGNSSFDSNSSNPDFRFLYDSARQENVTLRVTDESGDTDTYTQTITVKQGAPNATFTTSPQPGHAGEFITFNASNSTDPNNKIVKYEWDFVGDSSFDSNSSDPDFRFQYDSARQENVTLRVTDADGNTGTFTRTITVTDDSDDSGGSVPSSGDDEFDDDEGSDDAADNDDEAETTVQSENESSETGTSVQSSVQNAIAGQRIGVDVPAPQREQHFELDEVALTPAQNGSLSLDVEASSEPLNSTPDAELPSEGTEELGYVSVNASVDNANIEESQFTFQVDQEELDGLESKPENIAMYRYNEELDRWEERPTRVVGREDGELVLRTTGDRFSEWTVAAKTADLAITDTETDVEAATTGEDVRIQAFVTNTGGANGTYEAQLSANGEVIDRKTATVPANRTVVVDFVRTFDQPGRYEMQVNDVTVGQINVTEDSQEDTADGTSTDDMSTDEEGDNSEDDAGADDGSVTDGDNNVTDDDDEDDANVELGGFGIVVALLALVLIVGAGRYRSGRS